MSAHTEAPWRVVMGGGGWNINARHRSVVASTYLSDFSGSEDAANARLISAAPDLLAAMKALLSGLSDSDEEGLLEHADQVVAARAAIAKAEGQKT